jgi:hypothetical protein
MLKSDNLIVMACILAAQAVGAVLCLNFLMLTWTLDGNGLSVMTGRLPYWDFTNLWGGGRMALQGRVGDLFEPDTYRAALRALLSPRMLDQEWSYPPSMLMIGVPLATLPILPAYLLWTGLTLLGLYWAARRLSLSRLDCVFVLLAPPVIIDVMVGQNGALTAALLLGGLILAPKRPLVAGILFGLLTLKPHLGLLVPFCLLASRNYRAIASATATTACMILITAMIFGWSIWLSFFEQTGPLMRGIMEAPYPQGYHANAMTFFTLSRSLGLDLHASYAIQIAAAIAAIVAVLWLWQRRNAVDPAVRVALTGIMALCATPYGYTYDAVLLPVALVVLGSRQIVAMPLLALAWVLPAFNHLMILVLPSLGIIPPALVAAAGMLTLWRRRRETAAADPVKASAAPPVR